MATLIVPTQHATLTAAVAAAVSGDTIILEDGTYTEAGVINTFLARVKVVARNRGAVTIACLTAVFNTGAVLDQWEFHGIRFDFGGASFARMAASRARFSAYHCVFDWSGQTANNTLTRMALGSPAPSTNIRIVLRGCRFIFGTTYTNSKVVEVSGTGGTGGILTCIIEGCIFENVYGTSANTSAVDVIGSWVAGGGLFVRNNTVVNMRGENTLARAFRLTPNGTSITRVAVNNVIDNAYGSATWDDFTLTGGLTSVWTFDNNSRHHTNTLGNFYTSNGVISNLNNTTSTTSMLGSDLTPLPSSIAFRSGTTTGQARADYNLRAYFSTPSRGAVEYYPSRARFHISWQRIPFGGGITMDIILSGTHAVTFPAFEYRSFDSPMAVAYALTLLVAINAPASGASHGFEVYYTPGFGYGQSGYEAGGYRWQSTLPVNLTLSGMAASLFGSHTFSNATAGSLSTDPATLDSPYMMDEDVLGEETRAAGEYSDIGRPIAALRASGGERWIFRFKAVSPPEDPRQIGRTAAERVVGAFSAGRPMRVWRDLTNNVPWNIVTNPQGYSDIITASGDDSSMLTWYDTVRRRFDIQIEGVEIR
jgi:hypothetical protein